MPLSLTDVTTGTVISATTYNANNTAIENAINTFNGNNLSNASVVNSKLASVRCYSTMSFNLDTTRQTAYLLVPGTATWNVTYISGIISDNGTTNTTVAVTKGSVATNIYTASATLDTSTQK
jgi:hypothetical protein